MLATGSGTILSSHLAAGLGADHNCWSCSGSDGYCYPYACGDYCSTQPCLSVKATANAVPRLIAINRAGNDLSAAHIRPTTPIGAKISKAAMATIEAAMTA